MAGKSSVRASKEQRAALEALAASRERGEADRAARRALDAERLDQRTDCRGIRRARGHGSPVAQRFHARRGGGFESERGAGSFAREDRSRVASHYTVARRTGCQPAQLDDPAPHARDRGARRSQDQSLAAVQGVAKKSFRWRWLRHTLKGRQNAAEIDRVGLR